MIVDVRTYTLNLRHLEGERGVWLAAPGEFRNAHQAAGSVFQGRFLTLRHGRIDQRHILKVLDR